MAADLHPLKMAYRFEIEHLVTLKNGNKSILVEMGIEFCDDLWREIKSYLFVEDWVFYPSLAWATNQLKKAEYEYSIISNIHLRDARHKYPGKSLAQFAKMKKYRKYLEPMFKRGFSQVLKDFRHRVEGTLWSYNEDWDTIPDEEDGISYRDRKVNSCKKAIQPCQELLAKNHRWAQELRAALNHKK